MLGERDGSISAPLSPGTHGHTWETAYGQCKQEQDTNLGHIQIMLAITSPWALQESA